MFQTLEWMNILPFVYMYDLAIPLFFYNFNSKYDWKYKIVIQHFTNVNPSQIYKRLALE